MKLPSLKLHTKRRHSVLQNFGAQNSKGGGSGSQNKEGAEAKGTGKIKRRGLENFVYEFQHSLISHTESVILSSLFSLSQIFSENRLNFTSLSLGRQVFR